MKLIKLRDFLIVAAVCLAIIIVGSCLDGQITHSLFIQANLRQVGVIISNYALVPFFTLCFCTLFLGIASVWKKQNSIKVTFTIIFTVLIVFLAYQEFDKLYDMREYFGKIGAIINAVVFILFGLGVAMYFAYKGIQKYNMDYSFKVIVAVAAIVLATYAITTAIKYLWSRGRPIAYYSYYCDYTYFWQLNPFYAFKAGGYRDYFLSFPSGHTSSVVLSILPLFALSKIDSAFDNDRFRSVIVYYGLFLGAVVGLTRVMAGMHWLTDIGFGLLITFVIIYVGFCIVNSINEKKHYYDKR